MFFTVVWQCGIWKLLKTALVPNNLNQIVCSVGNSIVEAISRISLSVSAVDSGVVHYFFIRKLHFEAANLQALETGSQ